MAFFQTESVAAGGERVSVRDNLIRNVGTAFEKGKQPNVASIVQTSCLKRIDLLQRRIFATYDGPQFVSGTGKVFPWVLAPQVPPDRYWLLMFASLLSGPLEIGPTLEPGLWLLPAQGQRPNPALLTGNDPFFADYSTVGLENYGPPKVGLRIDDGYLNASSNQTIQVAGQEIAAFRARPYILVAPGEQLMGYCVNDAAAPPNGNQLELRIVYAQLQLGEEFDVF